MFAEQVGDKLGGLVGRLVGGEQRGNDLDQPEDGDWVEKVQVDDAVARPMAIASFMIGIEEVLDASLPATMPNVNTTVASTTQTMG